MTDGIHMARMETSREVHGLAQQGQQLSTDWTSRCSAIAGNEGGIGNDVLGQAFRGVYVPDSTAVREAAGKVPAAIMTDAGLGNQAVADYGDTDGGAASVLGNVR